MSVRAAVKMLPLVQSSDHESVVPRISISGGLNTSDPRGPSLALPVITTSILCVLPHTSPAPPKVVAFALNSRPALSGKKVFLKPFHCPVMANEAYWKSSVLPVMAMEAFFELSVSCQVH